MPLTYRNKRTGRTVRVPTPDEAAAKSAAPKRFRRIQEKRITELDRSNKWVRVDAPAPRREAPAPAAPVAAPEPPGQQDRAPAQDGGVPHPEPTGDAPTETEAAEPAPEPSLADVRAWAREQGIDVSTRGRLSEDVVDAYKRAHTGGGEG